MARGVATLFSENGKKRSSSPSSHGLKNDDNDELYAGGEMSAMAIETPKSEIDMKVKRLLEMAELNPAPPPPPSTTAKTASAKRKPKGPPQRLDGSIPTTIPEEQDDDDDEEDLVTEIGVYFWKNGFTCSTHNHRKLFSNEDPQTARLLEEMEKGFVPIEVFGESKRLHSGKISIVVERKLDVKWIPGSFDGVPRRLGDTPTFPAPSAPTMTTTTSTSTPQTATASTTTASTTITKELPNYDPSSTTTKIQIKYRNAKIIIKCNPLTHTVKDLYDAIDDSSSSSSSSSTNALLHSLRPPLVLEDRKDQRSLDELSLRNATLILK